MRRHYCKLHRRSVTRRDSEETNQTKSKLVLSRLPRQLHSFLSLPPPTSHHNIHVVRAAEYTSPRSSRPSRRTTTTTTSNRPQLGSPFTFTMISLLQLGFFRRGCSYYGGGLSGGFWSECCRERCGCAGAGAGMASLFFLYI